jgi:uncharacterized protein YxjI
MHAVFSQNLFFVKEHTGIFKAANNFDIYHPESNQIVIECREPNLGLFTKILRFSDYKRMTPFHLELRTPEGAKLMTVKRGVSLFVSEVEVLDEHDKLIGKFKQRFFSIGGKFDVMDAQGRQVCTLQGKWTGWDFRFVQGEREMAAVSKKWAGLGKELFTSADNYMLSIGAAVPANDPVRLLIVAAVMCIDMVLKE